MPIRLSALAELVEGQLFGDGSLLIRSAASLETSAPDEITFLDSPDKAHRLARSRARAVLVPAGFVPPGISAVQ
ncbi:MAG TPA: LpxD N-terminal domain-containing protein, partial [Terriglobales bacterium]